MREAPGGVVTRLGAYGRVARRRPMGCGAGPGRGPDRRLAVCSLLGVVAMQLQTSGHARAACGVCVRCARLRLRCGLWSRASRSMPACTRFCIAGISWRAELLRIAPSSAPVSYSYFACRRAIGDRFGCPARAGPIVVPGLPATGPDLECICFCPECLLLAFVADFCVFCCLFDVCLLRAVLRHRSRWLKSYIFVCCLFVAWAHRNFPTIVAENSVCGIYRRLSGR